MNPSVGLERMQFNLKGRRAARKTFAPILVGVVGSGNLEVLLEPGSAVDGCDYRIETSARGFGTVWRAVIDDFHARHDSAGLCFSINDMGATPAVVGLRLEQAMAELAARLVARQERT